MTDTDARIDAALRAEERRLLEQIGEEPAFFSQAFGLFRARNAWVNWTMMIAQTALFIAGAYAAWRFFDAETTLDALRWGLPSAVMLLMALIIKLALWPVMQITVLRQELARLAMLEDAGRR
ncbi:DUF6768 family protein [Brevundimonas aveniformis]|uniref:DUF6768 family protein n=1 Tax=Brevundimonas aveniformis TaxID=370977 RepID=UPI0003F87BBE|nr:DUF6768 family protein [Brevundimonas aveniformis]